MRAAPGAPYNGVMTTLTLTDRTPFAIGGAFLDALSCRDFDGVGACLADDVHLRALLPPRDVDVVGREPALTEFRRWFGAEDQRLELLDAAVSRFGPRLHVRWVVRMSAPDSSRLVEQQAYVDADGPAIVSMRLLCSGFVAESTPRQISERAS
jgi:ketosteroid isomerase-like protein